VEGRSRAVLRLQRSPIGTTIITRFIPLLGVIDTLAAAGFDLEATVIF
jgi:hypothetical protein